MSRAGSPVPHDTFSIERPGQMEALVSPARQEILDAVAASGPLTVSEIAEALGRNLTSLYYHLSALRKAGLLVERQRRGSSRRAGAVYGTPARKMTLVPTDRTRETYGKIIASTVRVAERDFRRALKADPDLSAQPREIWGGRIKGWVSARDLMKINAHIEAIIRLLSHPRTRSKDRLQALTWVLASVPAKKRRGKPSR